MPNSLPAGVIGVIHLLPLPGAPRPGPGFSAVLARALADAATLRAAGAAGCIIENLGDAPYSRGVAEPHVVACMAVITHAIRAASGGAWPLGVNVLRNDPLAALGVALAADADFIRVNIHTGAMITDQGIIQGDARDTLLYRRRLESTCAIAADVAVKHAAPLGRQDIAQQARDTWHRGDADALIVTGEATGAAADPRRLRLVRDAVPQARLWVGSGITPQNAQDFRPYCQAAIVGTYLHQDSHLDAPLDMQRVRQVVAAFR